MHGHATEPIGAQVNIQSNVPAKPHSIPWKALKHFDRSTTGNLY